MPMTIPDGSAAVLIPLKHSLLTRSAAITFGVSTDTTSLAHIALCDAVNNAFATTLGTLIDNSVTIGPTHAAFGQADGSAVAVVGSASATGGSVVTSVPPAVAFLIRKTTNAGGKRGRGRFYLPWSIATANIDEGGTIAGATVTAMQTKATAFLTAIQSITGGVNMLLLHQTGSSVATVVTTLTADARAATQRRRQR